MITLTGIADHFTSERVITFAGMRRLGEFVCEAYPGERLVACYNPLLAQERSRKRQALLEATQAGLERVAREAARRTRKPLSAAELGRKVGRVLGRHQVGKHFEWEVQDGQLRYERNRERLEAEALSANIIETPGTLGMSGGRWR